MLAPTHCKTSDDVAAEEKRLRERLVRLVQTHRLLNTLPDNPEAARKYLAYGVPANAINQEQIDLFHALRLVLCEDDSNGLRGRAWGDWSNTEDRARVLDAVKERKSLFEVRRTACMRLMTMIQATEYELEAMGVTVERVAAA